MDLMDGFSMYRFMKLNITCSFPKPVIISSSSKEHILDYGILSATDTRSLVFVVVNNNPIEVRNM